MSADRIRNGTVSVLVNRHARRAGHSNWEREVRDRLSRRWNCEFAYPESVDEMVRLASSAIDRRSGGIIAAGGDGTVGRIAHVLSGTGVPFGVIPLGTGNDFQRSLGLPRKPGSAAERIVNGPTRRLDLGSVNGRCFTTIGVMGVPADAALTIDRLTRRGSRVRRLVQAAGSTSYRVAGLAALARASLCRARITVAGSDRRPAVTREIPIFGVCASNGRYFGGGLGLPVDGEMNDGLLDLCVVPALSRARLIWAFLCLVNGWRIPSWALEIIPAVHAVIECDRPLEFAADGDRICHGTRFELRALPGALSALC